ncbi:MAG TPA: ABC transporter permease [Candidatus Dormibacteraeota bacterium]|jgi:phospholipid/cholesterol/gamma-HCH transport system permease protein|nr:ABC transporter permease [Candidatus Dormibacteraeota bacterium]
MVSAPLARLRSWTRTLGEIVQFAAVSIAQIPQSARYVREVWWYAAFIAIGSTPVALVLTTATGAECSVEAYYSLSQIGALTLTGVFNAICDTREITPLFFGFAIGAKVGCGLVAELGTMRVNEEIDALEIMSMPTRVYLVSVRMLACFIVLPFMYLLSLAVSYLGSFLVQHFQIRQVSDGVYFDYFWRFLNTQDLFYSMIKAVVFAILIVSVAVYHGYNVTGGAVGIGRAVAKTMATALVMVVVVNAVLTQIFWGNNPNLPIQI